MKRFTKKQLAEYEELMADVCEAQLAAKDSVTAYNDAIAEVPNPEEELGDLSHTIELLNAWIEEAQGLMDDYFAERSREWQESKRGLEYQAWMNSLETIDEDLSQWPQELEELHEPEVDVPLLQEEP